MPFVLISWPFTEATPDILDPPTDGALAASIPAGSYVEADVLLSVSPDQDGNFYGYMTTAPGMQQNQVLYRTGQTASSPNADTSFPALPTSTVTAADADNLPANARAIASQQFRLAFYSAGTPPSAFTGELVLKIYS